MLKVLLLVTAVSADSFAASIGFGSAKIKIPFKSALVISIIGTVSLSLSVLFADVIGLFFQPQPADGYPSAFNAAGNLQSYT